MKVVSIKKEKILIVLYLLIIFIGVFKTYREETVSTFSMPISKKVVLIDAGHGGFDSGKVADSDTFEKDINLKIALKLQAYLEQGDSQVLMTRTTDEALGTSKAADMQKRKLIANTKKPDIFVSIHQNSYPDTSARGAQVFYYNSSDNSKKLADCIQKEIKSTLGQKGDREASPNKSYYVLRKTTVPAVIVECGFLTNYKDKKNLESEEYQDKMAWAIYKGIVEYFNSDDDKNKEQGEENKEE